MKILLAGLLLLTLAGCDPFRWRGEPYVEKKVWGWSPKFSTDTSHRRIYYEDGEKPNKRAGNIYVYKNWILQSEIGKGVHIIDKTDPANARKTGFLHIPGNTDISIKGNVLYANNFYDMIAIDISDLKLLKVIARQKNMFFTQNSGKPYTWQVPDSSGYYDCTGLYNADQVVIGWQRDSIYASCLNP